MIKYLSVGADNIWFTEDDAIYLSTASLFDSNGIETRTISYTNPGIDGIWLSADDYGAITLISVSI